VVEWFHLSIKKNAVAFPADGAGKGRRYWSRWPDRLLAIVAWAIVFWPD